MSSIKLPQGIDSGYTWPIVDSVGAPAVLTGFTAAAKVRSEESHTSALLFEFTANVVGSNVVIQWTAEQSLAWEWASGYCDVILINNLARPIQVVWQGQVKVDKVVTDA